MTGIKIYTPYEALIDKALLSAKIDQTKTEMESAQEAIINKQEQSLAQIQSASDAISDLAAKQEGFKKFYSGTSTQTVINKTQVLIPHGIPSSDPMIPSVRTPTLSPETEVAGGYRSVSVDSENIVIEYDVAIVSSSNGWVMKWML